jgi:hypothetical protein
VVGHHPGSVEVDQKAFIQDLSLGLPCCELMDPILFFLAKHIEMPGAKASHGENQAKWWYTGMYWDVKFQVYNGA